ncbi:MAG: hypothetical protein ACK4F7_09960, partial [Inhella sp.]
FVPLNERQALVVLVAADGSIENRVIDLPRGLPPGGLVEAGNYISAALSGLAGNPTQAEQAAQLDLFLRAAASALRVGKLNFAAIALPDQQGLRVGAAQALIEFSSALQAVGQQQLRPAQAQALQLAQQQWLLFRAALTEQGLAKGRERLPEVATTTERIADSLIAMAQRA